ncbi:chemotaxis protein CheC [Arhodomonas sp. AD133]|uniref:chemotaxis protein CheC n=1 Tax=Arhodomonas sp. AD133 TaxID=3415009 RepID=UPI003EB9F8FD
MSVQPFSTDQQDALQELANMAMGRAGAVLAEMLDAYIELSVPRVRLIDSDALSDAVMELTQTRESVAAVRQSFVDGLNGEAIALFSEQGCRGLADLLGHDLVTEDVERELLLDVSNILLGSVLRGLADHTSTRLSLSRPTILTLSAPVSKLLHPEHLAWDQALLVEVNFSLTERGFACHLVLLMPEDSIDTMRAAVNRLLEDIG